MLPKSSKGVNVGFKTRSLIALALSTLFCAPATAGWQSTKAQIPATLTIVGDIVSITGTEITIAAALDPKLHKTIRIDSATVVIEGRQKVTSAALGIGSRVVVKQVRVGQEYKTERIDHLGKKK